MKLKTNKYRTGGSFPKSNGQYCRKRKNDTPNTQIHDHSLSLPGTDTSLKSGGVRLNI
jgi:hypothetical protein